MLKLSIIDKEVIALVVVAVIIGCMTWFFRKDSWKDYKKCFLFSTVLYICYQLGMLGMYLFSMPLVEAAKLAGSRRYLRTIMIALFMVYMAFALNTFSSFHLDKTIRYLMTGILVIGVLSFSYVSQGRINFVSSVMDNSTERLWIEKNKEIYAVPMHKSYCMLIPDKDSGYARHLQEYIFQSKKASSVVVKTADDLNGIKAKYIFVYDKENDTINTWIKEKYPEQFGNDVIVHSAD